MTNETLRRWRLMLGCDSENKQGKDSTNHVRLSEQDQQRDQSLDYLYSREHDSLPANKQRKAGLEESPITPVKWLAKSRKLFPKSTVQFLQKQAIERYRLTQLLTDPEVLRNSTPNMTLVQTLLSFKNYLPESAMFEVQRIIRQVCEELEAALAQKILAEFSSRRLRHKHGGRPQLSNLDWSTTIRRNLKNFNAEHDAVILERLYFYQRQSSQLPWHLYVVVDQSGSMLPSLIHSAVIAAIFCKVRSLKTHLILFDTQIVDLSGQVDDPVENLLSVQLGGGTDIANAVIYTMNKITQPNRSLVVLISDFYEGGCEEKLLQAVQQLRDSQVKMLGLAALDDQCKADFNQHLAQQLCNLSMPVSAMTPDHLATWVAEQVGA